MRVNGLLCSPTEWIEHPRASDSPKHLYELRQFHSINAAPGSDDRRAAPTLCSCLQRVWLGSSHLISEKGQFSLTFLKLEIHLSVLGIVIPCGPPPCSTADINQATRKCVMTPNKLSLYIYRANHDFSRPTNYREAKGGKIQKKKKK